MKRFLVALAVVASLSAIPVSNALVKGHVPAHKDQVCHRGSTLTVGLGAADRHVASHGDCLLPTTLFNTATETNVFHTGDACDAAACARRP